MRRLPVLFAVRAIQRHLKESLILEKTRHFGRLCFSRYLLLTNTAITVCLSGTGDILAQRYEIIRKEHEKWDPLRTKRICATGLVIGPLCHYWYILLDAA